MIRQSKELQIGKAGEYLVCADLILKGFISFPSEQGLSYDVLLDTGEKLLRVQVKTTSAPRVVPQRAVETKCYIFNIKKCGKGNTKRYFDNEIDLFALVCLDTKRIGYVIPKDMPDTLNLRCDEIRGAYYDEKGILDFQNAVKLHETIKNKSEVARQIGIDVATINRYLKTGFKPHQTNARYFSDIERNAEWFIRNL